MGDSKNNIHLSAKKEWGYQEEMKEELDNTN